MRGVYPGPYSFPKPPERKHYEACIRDPRYSSGLLGVCNKTLKPDEYAFGDIKHAMAHYSTPGTSGLIVCAGCQFKVRKDGLQ